MLGEKKVDMKYVQKTNLGHLARASGMRRVVGVNEEIKGIVQVSRELSVEAINAMLAARRAGSAVGGFAVVTTELRGFSGRLQVLMDELSVRMASLVREVAGLSKEVRARRHLSAALALSGRQSGMAVAVERVDAQLAHMAMENSVMWRSVHRVIERAVRLCEVGRTLARGAKIEAVYGGGFSVQLSQIGAVIERTIEQIRGQLFNARTIAGAGA
jgi:hypothetical protein